MAGPVEGAIRSAVRPGEALTTPAQGKAFGVQVIDSEGVVLLLGEKWWTRLSWSCLEGIPDEGRDLPGAERRTGELRVADVPP